MFTFKWIDPWNIIQLIVLITCLLINHRLISAECPIERPKLLIDISQFNSTQMTSRGIDYIDLRVGSNLTLQCEAPMLDSNGEQVGERYIEWILPEYHPVSVV